MKRPLNALSAVLLALPSIAQVAVRWDAETSRPAQVDIPVMRGETVLIEPRLVQYGAAVDLAGSSAALWIQTNGMGSAWWQAPAAVSLTETGRVSAAFAPSNDVGAAAYTWFIGVTHTNSALSYRASGRLTIRAAPGAAPNALPPPVRLIDFSAVTPLNAPWLLSSSWISGSNALASALQAAIVTRLHSATNPAGSWIDGDLGLWRVSTNAVPAAYELDLSADFFTRYDDVPNPGVPLTVAFPWTQAGEFGVWEAIYDGSYYAYINFLPSNGEYTCMWQGEVNAQGTLDGTVLYSMTEDSGTATLRAVGEATLAIVTQRVDTLALQSSLRPMATTQQVAAAIAPLATTQQVTEVQSQIPSIAGLATTQQVADAVAPLATTQQVSDVQSQIPSVAGLATTQQVADAVAPLATTQQVAEVQSQIPSVAGLATTQQVADAVAPLATTQQVADVQSQIPSVAGLATTQQVADAVAPLATTQQVSAAIALIPAADLSGTVKISLGTATNLTLCGWVALPQTQATNLVLRLVSSNNFIIVQEVHP